MAVMPWAAPNKHAGRFAKQRLTARCNQKLQPLTQLVPGVLVVQGLCSSQGHLNVAALQRQVEARSLVRNKVQRNLQLLP
jgi:hypothetical protein